jgi:hypothetical protein
MLLQRASRQGILSLLLQIAFLHLFARILGQPQIDVPATRCFSQVGRKAVRKHAKPCVDSDIRLIGNIGEFAGLTTHYPPRTYHSITAESDAALGGITGDAWKHFITRWRKAGGDRRRIKGV